MSEGLIHVLTGCTAVGKTELALRWAEHRGAEIVSCDSLLFYRGMDVGTAKPSRQELARVPHHLVDVCEARDQMDIRRYLEIAEDVVCDIWSRGRPVLVTGGSGFYLKGFFEPVVDEVDVSDDLRTSIRREYDEVGIEPLVKRLEQLNPGGLGKLDVANPRRVMRALERCESAKMSLSELSEQFARQWSVLTRAEKRVLVLTRPKEQLETRMRLRVEAMLANGLIEEVIKLREEGFEANPSGANAIGYRETLEYLKGNLDRDGLLERIFIGTRQLAKKQRTWFRTQLSARAELELTDSLDADTQRLLELL